MTVGYHDPNTNAGSVPAIAVSDAARRHLETQIARDGRNALRLGVKESGCNGYMYTLDFIAAPGDDDIIVPTGGDLALYVRRSDLPLVDGTEVDFVREGLNASLRFRNPNAESHCGCGESFAITAKAH